MSESLSDDVFVETGETEKCNKLKCRSCGSDLLPGSWRRPSQKAKSENFPNKSPLGFFADILQADGADKLPRILASRRPIMQSQSSRVELLRQMSQSSTCTSSHRPLNSCSEETPSNNTKKTRLKNGLFAFLGLVAVCGTLILSVILYPLLQSYGYISISYDVRRPADIYCTSPACLRASARIVSRMDFEVDPCEDFYRFSCGNYLKTAYVPVDSHQVSIMQEMQDEVLVLLRNALEIPVSPSDLEAEVKAKTFYQSCMEEDYVGEMLRYKNYDSALLSVLTAFPVAPDIPVIGHWPILLGQLWEEQSALPLDELVGNLITLSTSTLFDVFLVNEDKIVSFQFFKVDPLLEKEWYEELWTELNLQSPATNQFRDILTEIHHLDNNGTGMFDHHAIYDYISPNYQDYQENQEKRKILSSFVSSSFNPKTKPSDSDQTEKKKIRKYLKAYRHLIEETVLLLSKGRKDLVGDVEDIVSFEAHLAKLSFDMCPDTDSESNFDSSDLEQPHEEVEARATLSDLSALVPSFNWERMIENVIDNLDPENQIKLKGNLTAIGVSLQCREYFSAVFELIQKTPKRTVYNYIIWRFIYNHLPYAGGQLRHLWVTYKIAAVHHTEEKVYFAKWKNCVEATNQGLGNVVAHMTLKNGEHGDLKKQVLRITDQVRNSFERFVSLQPWIEPAMKNRLIEKIAKMDNRIAFPDLISGDIEQEYSKLEVERSNFLLNTLRLRKFKSTKELLKPVEVTDRKSDWLVQPFTVNAFHNPATNEVILPIGILREPLFHEDYPGFILYSSLGVVVAHEIIHGFDDNGRRHDAFGNISSWWTDALTSAFREKADCFVSQYNKYDINVVNKKVDGNMTLGDNICDNGGLALAFRAYEQHRSFEAKKKLPGLSGFSEEQLFFISYGQIWCEVNDDTGYEKYTKEVHSPGEHRANGVLRNSNAFASSFGCPLNSPMNPVDKCSLWGD